MVSTDKITVFSGSFFNVSLIFIRLSLGVVRLLPNVQAQAEARETAPRRSRRAANLSCRPKLDAQRLLPAAIC
jgi:hypothetical protein